MEIKNKNITQPSFQMAFRMPKGENLKAFEKVVYNEYNCPKDVMRKGLDKFIKEQSKNKRFDVRFNNNKFEVIDKNNSDKLIESYDEKTFCPNRYDRSFDYYSKKLDETRGSDIKHGFVSLAGVLSMIKESFIERFILQQENLPSGLRKAGERANVLEEIYALKSPNLKK